MSYVIAEPCVGVKDAACINVCPADCIHTRPEADQYYINPEDCIDCGLCQTVCPVEAIFLDQELPRRWAHFAAKNRDFFNSDRGATDSA